MLCERLSRPVSVADSAPISVQLVYLSTLFLIAGIDLR